MKRDALTAAIAANEELSGIDLDALKKESTLVLQPPRIELTVETQGRRASEAPRILGHARGLGWSRSGESAAQRRRLTHAPWWIRSKSIPAASRGNWPVVHRPAQPQVIPTTGRDSQRAPGVWMFLTSYQNPQNTKSRTYLVTKHSLAEISYLYACLQSHENSYEPHIPQITQYMQYIQRRISHLQYSATIITN